MARKVFYSFYYKEDSVRAAKVRGIGVVEGNPPASDNDWEKVEKGGPNAIADWIDNQLVGRTCTVVLIGANTAGRKWISYEIRKSWNEGMGLVGIHIHNLTDFRDQQSSKGQNPFNGINVGAEWLSLIAKTYDPPGATSKEVYRRISENLSAWIEEAIAIRARY